MFSYTDVCLLCLDFERFTLAGTGGSANVDEGECLDMFTVTVRPNIFFEKKIEVFLRQKWLGGIV